jgi:ABC-type polysaccharide/polyol phosphate transport system ATPase subunit
MRQVSSVKLGLRLAGEVEEGIEVIWMDEVLTVVEAQFEHRHLEQSIAFRVDANHFTVDHDKVFWQKAHMSQNNPSRYF